MWRREPYVPNMLYVSKYSNIFCSCGSITLQSLKNEMKRWHLGLQNSRLPCCMTDCSTVLYCIFCWSYAVIHHNKAWMCLTFPHLNTESNFDNMCTICVQYAYNMPTICIQYAYNMHTICIQYVYNMHTICVQYAYNMHTICVQHAYNMCTICIQYV